MKVSQIPIDSTNNFKDGDYISMENYVLISGEDEIIRNWKVLKIDNKYSTRHP